VHSRSNDLEIQIICKSLGAIQINGPKEEFEDTKGVIRIIQKKRYKDFFRIYFYVKTKTIVYYHLRQCLRETRLSSQNKE
jgi:hypothetical protein